MTFPSGVPVRVRNDWPEARGPCHIRTPHYLRGRTGVVDRFLGAYPNPEDLAFGRAVASVPLYHVRFDQPSIWNAGRPGDEVLAEIYEGWLEPVA